jgi:leucyl/phenylalanyl-tRNA--protein transferase
MKKSKQAVLVDADYLWFPPLEHAEEDGLLALTFDFSCERILLGYKHGVFPWYQHSGLYHWFAPDPRCVLFPNEVRISKSMKKILKDNCFDFKINYNFVKTMQECASIIRRPTMMNGKLYTNEGTWINDNYLEAYTQLNSLGYALSAEVYLNNQLVGGLYGLHIGKVFFGESMFAHVSNASKFAFFKLLDFFKTIDVQMIDCQQPTPHLLSLGARCIPIKEFKKNLKKWC